MNLKRVLVLFLFLNVFCDSIPSEKVLKCGKRGAIFGRIWGGENTELNAWPWLVAFRHLNNFFCGGSLVSSKHVVSGMKEV